MKLTKQQIEVLKRIVKQDGCTGIRCIEDECLNYGKCSNISSNDIVINAKELLTKYGDNMTKEEYKIDHNNPTKILVWINNENHAIK